MRTDQGCSETAIYPNAAFGEWHHLAGVFDGVDIKLYRDGNLVATTPYTQQGSFTTNIATTEIGRHQHDYQAFGYFFGSIDEVRIWDYALSSDEINERMFSALSGNEQGLLSYWNFDDGTAGDLTGSGNDGVLQGDANIIDSEMDPNRVLVLDGNGDYVALPQPIMDGTSFSIEAWYKLLGEGGGIEQQNFIFTQRADHTGCNHSAIALVARARPDLPQNSFSLRTDLGCTENATYTNVAFGEWHHLAGVFDGIDIKLYRDGNLVATTPYTQEGSFTTNIATTEIGRHRHDYQDFGYFFGSIDEVRIWDYALSPEQINARMFTVLTGDEQGLLSYWNFDDGTAGDLTGSGNDGVLMDDASIVAAEISLPENGLIASYPFDGNANDVSGHEIHGMVEGATLTEDRFGNENSAYYFDGGNDVIALGNDPRLSPNLISVTAWFSSNSQSVGSPATQFIIRNKLWGYSISMNSLVNLETPHIGGIASVFYIDGETTQYKFVSNETTYNDGQWHFVVASFDGLVYKFYIDGQVVYQDSSIAPGSIYYQPMGTAIGRGLDEWSNAFEGKIDDVEIYNHALTSEEIDAAYHMGNWDTGLLSVSIPDAVGQENSTILIPIHVSLPADSLYRAVEMDFSAYSNGLEFIGIDTSGSMIGGLNWTWAENEVGGVLNSAFAGSDEISGEGVLFYLEFLITGQNCNPVSIRCDYAMFNDTEATIISNGLVHIVPQAQYGDVDENDTIQALDASDILLYLIDDSYLDCQSMANADTYLDGHIDGMDASIILRYLVGLETELPVTPNATFLASCLMESTDQEAVQNASISVPFIISNVENIYSFEGQISYDPNKLQIDIDDPVSFAASLGGFMKSVSVDEAQGKIQFVGVSANPGGEAGEFLSVNFSSTGDIEIGTSADVMLDHMKFNSNYIIQDVSSHIDVVVSVADKLIPEEFELRQNYPNPFNPSTSIRYALPEESSVSLVIYDIQGKVMNTIVSGQQSAGWYDVNWSGETSDGTRISTGIYFARLQTGSDSQVIKMLYLK
ncbi:MAG: T9SS type A sorting domain-containing protein [Candidatus Marinimicrobia bacterium]|nr:T9SS type A sorting domain-containing protein [Candidatus Neomarinimicrobiota bacterium]